MADGGVSRLTTVATPAAPAPPAAAGIVATPTANGGVTIRKEETTAPATEPTLILGKFKSPADLEAAYVALEKKLGAPKPAETPAAPAAPAVPVDAAAAAAKGIDLAALGNEYVQNGKLSDASMAALATAGITEAQVTTYIAGQKAIADKISADLATVTGGQEKLTATLEWAKANATAEQKAVFDAALDSGNTALLKLALTNIHADYVKAVGSDPALVTATPAPGTAGVQPFASQAEVTAAMRDKRYKNGDRAYIASVEARIKAANGKLWGQGGR